MLPHLLDPELLAAAGAEAQPESLAASVRLRRRWPAEQVAAAVTLVVLRLRARAKFGAAADEMFFTRDGLEQATRPEVADHRATELRARGVSRVVDLGCGIGSDALAFARAGLAVLAVDQDPLVVEVARANLAAAKVGLGASIEVRVASAEDAVAAASGSAVFCDPARRSERGRSWRIEDLSPSWAFVGELLERPEVSVVKLGPGLPHRLIGERVEAEWVSHRGDLVELALWSGPGAAPGRRSALVLPGHRLVADPSVPAAAPEPPGQYLYEPLGAVVRAGCVDGLATDLAATRLATDLGYLSGDELVATPYAESFEILDRFPYGEKALRQWVRLCRIGMLEIKTRGLGLDPATLRRRLRLDGPETATVVITPTTSGRTVLVVRRLQTAHTSGLAQTTRSV